MIGYGAVLKKIRGLKTRINLYIQKALYDKGLPKQKALWQERSRAYFEENESRKTLIAGLTSSTSTGAGLQDYYFLHRYIKERNPSNVLEFGSGATSLVMAHAFMELDRESESEAGCITTLEDIEKYHLNLVKIIPSELAPYINAVLSPKIEDTWRDRIWGFRYSAIPEGEYDMVWVDGPTEYADTENLQSKKGVCLDLLYLLDRQPSMKIDVLVDQKFNSLTAYQSVLPKRRAGYDPVFDMGVIRGVSGSEIRNATHWEPLVRRCNAESIFRGDV